METKFVTPEEYETLSLNFGKLQFWDEEPFLKAAEILVAGDEPLAALDLLKNKVPAYYREKRPPAFQKIINDIEKLLCTPTFYMTNKYDAMVRDTDSEFIVENTFRGTLIRDDVKRFNATGQTPHIVDLGPGEYWLPIGLSKLGHNFTYKDIGLCMEAQKKAYPLLERHLTLPEKDAPSIFVACELIEHLHHENDIRIELMKQGRTFDIIHMSTPKYSFDGSKNKLNWRDLGDLGHLRTYTPREFQDVVADMFPEYNWAYGDQQVMHMKGTLKDGYK